MTVSQWPTGVNTKIFGFSKLPKENATVTTFLSGRTVAYKNNERALFTYSFSLALDKPTELNTFWTWYNDTLGGTTGAFTCSAIGSGYYRFTGVPEPADTDTQREVLNFNVEEVY